MKLFLFSNSFICLFSDQCRMFPICLKALCLSRLLHTKIFVGKKKVINTSFSNKINTTNNTYTCLNHNIKWFGSWNIFIRFGVVLFWFFFLGKKSLRVEWNCKISQLTMSLLSLLTPEAEPVSSFVPFSFDACSWEKGEN